MYLQYTTLKEYTKTHLKTSLFSIPQKFKRAKVIDENYSSKIYALNTSNNKVPDFRK